MKIPHKIGVQKSKAAGIEQWMDGGGCGGKMARHTRILWMAGILLPLGLRRFFPTRSKEKRIRTGVKDFQDHQHAKEINYLHKAIKEATLMPLTMFTIAASVSPGSTIFPLAAKNDRIQTAFQQRTAHH